MTQKYNKDINNINEAMNKDKRRPGLPHDGRLQSAHLPALEAALSRAQRPEALEHHGDN